MRTIQDAGLTIVIVLVWLSLLSIAGFAIAASSSIVPFGSQWLVLAAFAATACLLIGFLIWRSRETERLRGSDPTFFSSASEYIGVGALLGLIGLLRAGSPISLEEISSSIFGKAIWAVSIIPLIFSAEFFLRTVLQKPTAQWLGWRIAILACIALPLFALVTCARMEPDSLLLIGSLGLLLATVYQCTSNWVATAQLTSSWLLALIIFSPDSANLGPLDWYNFAQAAKVAIASADALLPALLAILCALVVTFRLERVYRSASQIEHPSAH